jgi:hypothetical protein
MAYISAYIFIIVDWLLKLKQDDLSGLDKTFLEIVSPIAECFVNIDAMSVQGLLINTSLRQRLPDIGDSIPNFNITLWQS